MVTVHDKIQDYKCNLGGKRFGMICNLRRHVKTVHKNEEIKKENHECQVCCKIFPKMTMLTDHISIVHEDTKRHACTYCGKEYGWSDHLAGHIREYHLKKNTHYECEICNKSYSTIYDLNKHAKVSHSITGNVKKNYTVF